MEETGKKSKAKKKRSVAGRIFGTLGIIILALILIAVCGVLWLYNYLKTSPIEGDDFAACVSAEPMSAEERLAVSANDSTVTFRLDKNDIYWVMDDRGITPDREDVQSLLKQYSLRLGKWSISFGDGVLTANVELFYKDKLRLPLHADIMLDYSGKNLKAKIASIRLGDRITLEPERISPMLKKAIDDAELPVTENGMDKDFCSRMLYLEDIAITPDAMTVTCALGKELFTLGTLMPSDTRLTAWFAPEYNAAMLAMEALDTGEVASFGELMSGFEADPASLVSFRYAQLVQYGKESVDSYFDDSQLRYKERFFARFDRAEIAREHDALIEERNKKTEPLEEMTSRLFEAMNEGDIRYDSVEKAFYKGKKPLDIQEFFAEDWERLTSTLCGDNVRIGNADKYTTEQYFIGVALRANDGVPVMGFYELLAKTTFYNEYAVTAISEEEYASFE